MALRRRLVETVDWYNKHSAPTVLALKTEHWNIPAWSGLKLETHIENVIPKKPQRQVLPDWQYALPLFDGRWFFRWDWMAPTPDDASEAPGFMPHETGKHTTVR